MLSEDGELLVNATGLGQRSWCVRQSKLPTPQRRHRAHLAASVAAEPVSSAATQPFAALRRPLNPFGGPARPRVSVHAVSACLLSPARAF